MDPTENRYAHLLQPIRELTKNWEIDVASELNDYLEEVSFFVSHGPAVISFTVFTLLLPLGQNKPNL